VLANQFDICAHSGANRYTPCTRKVTLTLTLPYRGWATMAAYIDKLMLHIA